MLFWVKKPRFGDNWNRIVCISAAFDVGMAIIE